MNNAKTQWAIDSELTYDEIEQIDKLSKPINQRIVDYWSNIKVLQREDVIVVPDNNYYGRFNNPF